MARPFSTSDARNVVSAHEALIRRASNANSFFARSRTAVVDAAQAAIEKATMETLAQIPVEELNFEGQGLRLKALRDAGYQTVADVYSASVDLIDSIRGIGEGSARTIKANASQIASTTRASTKLRLSYDDQTEESTELLTSIFRYKNVSPAMTDCGNAVAAQGRSVEMALRDLAPATGNLSWTFASGNEKQTAYNAYQYLLGQLQGLYGTTLNNALGYIENPPKPPQEYVWNDFANDPVSYITVLEELCPDLVGDGNAQAGLPEDLAEEVQGQEILLDGLLVDLRRYQEWGVKYVLHQGRVLLGDEMGLGKTVEAIAAMVSLRNTGATHFMVVCPASVLSNWCREIAAKSLLNVVKLHGDEREEAFDSWVGTGGVAVTTYESTAGMEMDDDFRFGMLVVDEAHYVKNPEAQRTARVKRIGEHAENVLFMTGTALENDVDEMVSLIEYLQPEVAEQVGGMTFLSAAPQFREKVAPVYYRRRREDVLQELPEMEEIEAWCTMGSEEEAVYEEAVLARKFSEVRRVSWNVDTSVSSKAQRLLEIVEEAETDGRKVLVFSFFLDTLAKVQELLGDSCVGRIDGSVAPERRQSLVDELDAATGGSVLAAQIQAGGTGLNIQTASVVVICEPQLKPSTESQAISRAYRMGQARNVLVYRLLCDDTVDEKILELLREKQQIFDSFADESAAAQETAELDESAFGSIMDEETERIRQKRGETGDGAQAQIEGSGELPALGDGGTADVAGALEDGTTEVAGALGDGGATEVAGALGDGADEVAGAADPDPQGV